ncbi:MAG: hypothetical protein H7210_14235 [Pyrinomonadaceae bacterium]|nr:hypothetical protein [Phycisphaerales bacterium]
MRRACLCQCVFVPMCLTSAVAADIDWDRLKLPAAVRLEVIGYNDDKPDEPYDKIIAEIGPDWVRSEQHLWEGEFHFRIVDVTYDTMDESILCNLNTKRGTRGTRMSRLGSSRVESVVTPIVYVRMARLIERRGGRIDTSRQEGRVTYSYSPPPGTGIPRVEMVVDAASQEIEEVRMPGPRSTVVVTYFDWKTLPDGSRHPMRIVTNVSREDLKVKRDSVVTSIELLKPGYMPARFKLPQDVEITDEIQGFVTDGKGTRIGAIEQAQHVRGTGNGAGERWDAFFVPGGAGLIAASGLAWYVQRRRART